MNNSDFFPLIVGLSAGALLLGWWFDFFHLVKERISGVRAWKKVQKNLEEGWDVTFFPWTRKRWTEVSHEIGLTFTESPFSLVLAGIVGDFRIQVKRDWHTEEHRIDLDGQGQFPCCLEIRRSVTGESFTVRSGERLEELPGLIELIGGGDSSILAVLDDETRTQLREMRAWITRGHLFIFIRNLDNVQETVSRLLMLARRLVLAEDEIPGRLARNAREDPVPWVRRQNLATLIEKFPSRVETLETCKDLVKSEEPGIRFMAAKVLGHDGLEFIRELLLTEGVPIDIRSKALQVVFREIPETQARQILDQLSKESTSDKIPLLVRGLEKYSSIPIQQELLQMTEKMDNATATSLFNTIRQPLGDAAERILLNQLDRRSGSSLVAAVSALGWAGSRDSVYPLLQMAEKVWASELLKASVQIAVQRIQARLQGADAGQLSLAQPAEGAGGLSLAEGGNGSAGALSLPAEEEPPAPAGGSVPQAG